MERFGRAQRTSAETADAQKRTRLAAAAVHGGSWAPFTRSEREHFTRLVSEFDALHVWLLHYFADPSACLKQRGRLELLANIMMAGISTGLEQAFGQPQTAWADPVSQAASDLDRNELASIPLTTMMSADGILTSRTSPKGMRFLTFLSEPESVTVEPPSL